VDLPPAAQVDHRRAPDRPLTAGPVLDPRAGSGVPDEPVRQNSERQASICMGVPPSAAFDLQAVLQSLWSRSFAHGGRPSNLLLRVEAAVMW